MIIFFVILLAIALYFYAFNNRDKNLDYKLTSEYQKSGNDDKLRADILKELETVIKKEVITSFSDATLRIKAIENLIKTREASYYLNIESIAQQYKISHSATFDAIFSSLNHVRFKFNLPTESYPSHGKQKTKKTDITESEFFSDVAQSLTRTQKLACNTFIAGITSFNYITDASVRQLYSNIADSHLKILDLRLSETYAYQDILFTNMKSHKDTLNSLNDKQKDLLVFMAMELLWCNGEPTQLQYNKFQKEFERTLAISENDFAQRVLKLSSIKTIS
ncbi:hypothetical protein [Flavobacterium sp. HJSW_4]|uniref:hypothetical protein n=1 Tax=Flavobacterium sp. HJSW_4 TaxID=3344660 RepID=UPI0036D3DE6C